MFILVLLIRLAKFSFISISYFVFEAGETARQSKTMPEPPPSCWTLCLELYQEVDFNIMVDDFEFRISLEVVVRQKSLFLLLVMFILRSFTTDPSIVIFFIVLLTNLPGWPMSS